MPPRRCSLLAARLFAQIKMIFGKNLPSFTLLEAPTVEQLAGILREEGWSAPLSSLETIETGGAGFTNARHKITKHIANLADVVSCAQELVNSGMHFYN